MIGETHVRHTEIADLDSGADENEVELDARNTCREGGQSCAICASQPCRAHEQIDLVRTPEGVEVPCHDDRFLRLHDQVVQRSELLLPMPELQRQVHEEHAHVFELQLDDEALDALVEIMEALAVHVRR